MKKIGLHAVWLFALLAVPGMHALAKTPSAPQQTFFTSLQALCGKAYSGKVVVDKPSSNLFREDKLVMHVRKCDDQQIQIPFHIGQNASRTWLITRTQAGLTLKHDHRHQDGTSDELTMYGGVSTKEAWAQVQSFPADQDSKAMFVKLAMMPSLDNTWQMSLSHNTFSYRLIRKGREVKVDFDISQPVDVPAAPWGYQD